MPGAIRASPIVVEPHTGLPAPARPPGRRRPSNALS